MSQYRKIMLIVDPTMDQTAGFRRAREIARSTGAKLLLYLFDHHNTIKAAGLVNHSVADMLRVNYLREKIDWLHDTAMDLREAGLDVQEEIFWGAPLYEKIIARIKIDAPDLVIKDAHFEPLVKRVLFTPLDWHLLRLCPAPLMLVNAQAAEKPKRIFAAIDPTHAWHSAGALNDRILQTATRLASKFHAALHLVHVFEGLPPAAMASGAISGVPLYPAELYEDLRSIANKQFMSFTDRHGVDKKNRHLLYGSPATAIAALANNAESDLVVMGTIYRTGLKLLMMGNTAERVLEQLSCDVLAIKPEGFDTDFDRHSNSYQP